MTQPKTIAVVGATGAQGGGLIRAILDDPAGRFRARAITRNPGSEAARELAGLGAEVVAGDVDDEASLVRAFGGAWGAYCVTFYWAHLSPEREIANAGAMARAARTANLEHVIWSTLEDTRALIPPDDDRMPTLMGRYKVPHFDAKGESDRLFTDAGVPTTFLRTSFFWDNFIHFGAGPKPGPDGTLVLAMPIGNTKLPGIAARDIGRCAYGAFRRGDSLIGKTVGIAGEHLSGVEMAASLTRALGQPVSFYPIDPGAFRALGFPGADDLGNMFQFNRDFTDVFRAVRSVERSRELNPALQTLDQWLARNASRIPLD